jgi:putative FmdB family regulatory protein
MPVYEFRCLDCRRKFDITASYNNYDPTQVRCPHCQSSSVQRRIGRIRFARSEDSRLENMTDPSKLAGLEDDPRALGKMMRQMSAETGEELGPEFHEVVNRLEAGQSPEDIEKNLPELAGDDDASSPGDMGGMDDF